MLDGPRFLHALAGLVAGASGRLTEAPAEKAIKMSFGNDYFFKILFWLDNISF